MYLPTTVIVTKYFDKRLAFASCISSGGAGVGTFIFAPIVNLLDDNYGWRFTLIILGILVLVCVPLGVLYKPIDDHEYDNSTVHNDVNGDSVTADVCIFSKCDAAKKCCKMIFCSMAEKGKKYINLFVDARFSLYIFSNFFTCMGLTVPFIFTLVGLNHKIYTEKFITSTLRLTGSCIDYGN